jgi:hypothetical protein
LEISSSPPYDARLLDEIARDKVAYHLYLPAGNELARYLRFYTSDVTGSRKAMITNYGLNAFVKFGPEYHSFTDHMVIADVWLSGGKVPALMRAATFKLARNGGPLFLILPIARPGGPVWGNR